ncbi:DUF6455 family protein [Roseovarius salinarum]|uniref:DUF6455 family protein n=1 Tax=Roseovarius salinarum TaxID=1981892 RepID=UPI0013000CFB|nr:DUF6455 family protein [Roseovarius salinarum]
MGLMKVIGQMERRADVMGRMAQRLGVDWSEEIAAHPDRAAGMYRGAVVTCAQCEREGDCLRWMERHETSDHTPDFCLNKELLEGMRGK